MTDEPVSLPPEQEKIRRWVLGLNTSDKIAIVATAIALVSLAFSLRSCQQAERSLAMTQRDFEGSRRLIWTGYVTGNKELHLGSSNPDAIIETVSVIFPKEFGIGDLDEFGPSGVLNSSNNVVRLKILHDKLSARPLSIALERAFTENFGEGNDASQYGYLAKSSEMSLPIAIETRYIVKGEHRFDKSLYFLPYFFKIQGTPVMTEGGPIYTSGGPLFSGIDSELKFEKLRFATRIDGDNSRDVIERLSRKNDPETTRKAIQQ